MPPLLQVELHHRRRGSRAPIAMANVAFEFDFDEDEEDDDEDEEEEEDDDDEEEDDDAEEEEAAAPVRPTRASTRRSGRR